MTGLLNPDGDRIIEMAMVVTNSELEMVAESPAWVGAPVRCGRSPRMDEWNQKTHGRSGLIEQGQGLDHRRGSRSRRQALDFMQKSLPGTGHSPMCGNSIGQDRRFMARYMPTLEDFFHYRNLDVSTLKELCKRWQPEMLQGLQEEGQAHRRWPTSTSPSTSCKYYRRAFPEGLIARPRRTKGQPLRLPVLLTGSLSRSPVAGGISPCGRRGGYLPRPLFQRLPGAAISRRVRPMTSNQLQAAGRTFRLDRFESDEVRQRGAVGCRSGRARRGRCCGRAGWGYRLGDRAVGLAVVEPGQDQRGSQ